VTPSQTSLSGLPSATPAPSTALPAPAPATAPATVSVSQRLLDWSQAWQDKDPTAYAAFYDPSFKPESGTRAQWLANRAVLLRKEGPITVKLSNVQRKTLSPTLVETSFDLAYSATDLQDNVRKTLTWKRSGGTWTIVREVSR
jgi:adhesin transport system outer membrane protein